MSLVRLWNRFPLRVEVPFPRDEHRSNTQK